MTNKSPHILLDEANTCDVWRPPVPYKIQFAKQVQDVSTKVQALHTLLDRYRVQPTNPHNRGFFQVTLERISECFNLMDGKAWVGSDRLQDTSGCSDIVGYCRNMKDCFMNGQRIRHTITSVKHTWVGKYDSSDNKIVLLDGRGVPTDIKYKSMSGFAKDHYERIKTNRRTTETNGWRECECEMLDGTWVSTYQLPI